ncbi:MAG TPA: hypothetical protein VIC55_11405 [Gemmatimonadaceae bacterium]|jgi:hypothetical protein
MITLQQLVRILEPWQSAYSNSKVLPVAVTAVHLTSLLFGGGLAVASDRSLLRAMRADAAERVRQLVHIREVHRPVLVALALMFVSGLLFATADIKTFLTTPAFYVKLSLVALLVTNGAVLTITETRLRLTVAAGQEEQARPLWNRLRVSSWCSLFLWSATLLAGVVLANVT